MAFFIIILVILFLTVVVLVLPISESIYVYFQKRPLFVHLYLRVKRLPVSEEEFLREHFLFYQNLDSKQKRYFQHRIIRFLDRKRFLSRGGFQITPEVKLQVAATAVMLTFGMRRYMLPVLRTIIIYPDSYFSKINQAYHKGEFNPGMRTLVFSWPDFVKGFAIENDNINLGIHEFIHVLQYNSYKTTDVSADIFVDANADLEALLEDWRIKNKVETLHFFREYAFTNRHEFLAVVVECFIESPEDFKQQFPKIYGKIREMLNYNFLNY